jgi:hypothetical protein
MGTIWISRRADLTPAYAMIVRRLKSLGADWVYHFTGSRARRVHGVGRQRQIG